jgi:acyl-CoA synthetase (AMP-forming)/AMP-acid ligase II
MQSNANDSLLVKSQTRADKVYIDLLLDRLTEAGDTPVLRYQGRDITAEDFLQSIFRYARALNAVGIGRGKLVAMFAPNCPEALAIRYATNLLGAAAIYLSVPSSLQSRSDLLERMNPWLLILFPETAHLLPNGVAAKIAGVGENLTGVSLYLDELAATQASNALASSARPNDLAVIISSGGTTGVPKGSWRTFASYTAMVCGPSRPSRRQLINGPLAYLSQVLVDITLQGGGSVVLEDAYDATRTLATIEAERITDLFLVEPQLFEVMDHPDVGCRDLSSLQTLTHIGASAPPILRRRASERLGAVLTHTYGASEMGLVSMLSPAEHDSSYPERFACVGRIRPDAEVRFRRDDGTLAAPGEAGSIEVRSPAMAGGYYNNPELSAKSFQDGWYLSGDFGQLDAEGYLRIFGRTADLSWNGDALISPTAVEDTLCQLPSVRYAVVVADHHTGSKIAAIVPCPEQPIDLAQCRGAIATRYGVAAAEAFLLLPMNRIPLTEQGKPDRAAIIQLIALSPLR